MQVTAVNGVSNGTGAADAAKTPSARSSSGREFIRGRAGLQRGKRGEAKLIKKGVSVMCHAYDLDLAIKPEKLLRTEDESDTMRGGTTQRVGLTLADGEQRV